jgi:hypothetical protein
MERCSMRWPTEEGSKMPGSKRIKDVRKGSEITLEMESAL